MSGQQSATSGLTGILQEHQRLAIERKSATALSAGKILSGQKSSQAQLAAMWLQQQRLVNELKQATPARQLQLQAEIVSLTEERSKVLQEAGEANCFIHTISGSWGTIWIEEERYANGSSKYRYGYYRDGKSHRRNVPKYLVVDVQRMISSGAYPSLMPVQTGR